MADLRYEPFAQSEISRIDELRLGALEDRFDADLALGRHHELVAELEPLVAAAPFRERARAQLMLALYRCGRQTDALQVFQSGRKALVEEVGIEPGPALKQLERQILNQPVAAGCSRSPSPTPVEEAPTTPLPGAGGALGRPELGRSAKSTILFADVIGSTELGEQLDPERLRALLRTYFEAMSEVIASCGGTLEKYIGDAIVAVFGVPTVLRTIPSARSAPRSRCLNDSTSSTAASSSATASRSRSGSASTPARLPRSAELAISSSPVMQ